MRRALAVSAPGLDVAHRSEMRLEVQAMVLEPTDFALHAYLSRLAPTGFEVLTNA